MENEKLVMLSESLSHSLFKNKRVITTFKLNIADFDNDIVKLNNEAKLVLEGSYNEVNDAIINNIPDIIYILSISNISLLIVSA